MPSNNLTVELPDWAGMLWENNRHLALYGGRGGAKSRSIAMALVLQAAESPRRILCCREIQKSIKDSVKRLLDDQIARAGLSGFFDSVENEIRGANGSLIVFAGLKGNANQIKSFEGLTDVWVEEAQTVSQSSIDTLIPTVRADGSRLFWSWNPDLPSDPVDSFFRGNDENNPHDVPENAIVKEVNYTDNPWFPEVLKEDMEFDRERDFDKYQHIWLGQYRQNSEARVFKNWKVSRFDSPDNVEYRIGADFGFSIDPTISVRCWIDGTNLYVDHEAHGRNVEINHLPDLFRAIPDAEKYWMTADSARPETISYLRNHGFPRIAPALKGARSLEEGVEFLKSYDIIVHERCQHVIDELNHYSYEVDPLTQQVLAKLEDKNNHAIDALRYAVEGARRALAGKDKVVSVTVPKAVFTR